MLRCGFMLAAVLGAVGLANAEDLKTTMTQRGKLLVSDDFSSSIGKEWKKAKGKWEIKDGHLQAAELKSDMHGAAMRQSMPLTNVIFQYDLKFDGASKTTLSINATKGHLSRMLLSPTSVVVKKDSLDHNATDKGQQLDERKVDLKPGTWHTVLVELQGKEILANVDNKVIAYGKHDGIAVPKGNFGLTVAGESMSFKNFRAWEAQPNPAWETERAKLETRGKGN